MLNGKRVKLRAVEDEDLPKIVAWRNQPEMYEYFYEFEPLSMQGQRLWFEKHTRDSTEKLFIISTLENEAIGCVGFVHIDQRNRKAEWGRFFIAEGKYRSGNYGSEVEMLILEYAFDHLNLNKLYCEVLATNERVISLHKKFGFVEEGTLRQHIYKKGAYLNVVILSLLREEYSRMMSDQHMNNLKKKLLGY